jgi:Protein of unknown function VcgC/VcgE (DUF2780)
MQDLIQSLVKTLKIDEQQASGGAAIIFKAARDKLGATEFGSLLGKTKGIDELIAKAPASGGLGKLFGGFAAALGGGNAALLATVLSGFNKLGLTQQHAQQFVPVIMDYLRATIGKPATDKLEKTLRA